MEVWILHIREEDQTTSNLYVTNEYSAWCTEQQALKTAAKWLQSSIDSPYYTGPFVGKNTQALARGIAALIKDNNISEAIELANQYTQANGPTNSSPRPTKITITVTLSKFLGSAFD
jgi:hypothetical protein